MQIQDHLLSASSENCTIQYTCILLCNPLLTSVYRFDIDGGFINFYSDHQVMEKHVVLIVCVLAYFPRVAGMLCNQIVYLASIEGS